MIVLQQDMPKEGLTTVTITKDTPLETVKEFGKECTRCNRCCELDSALFMEEDVKRVAKHFGMTREDFIEHFTVPHERFNTKLWKAKQIKQGKPYGKCIFLDDQYGCSIHEIKPKYCQVCSTKSARGTELVLWFALNYLVNPNDPESIRQWAQYLHHHPTIPGGELNNLVPDKDKLRRMLNHEMLYEMR